MRNGKSSSAEPPHLLIAMGTSEKEAHCSVRLSLPHSVAAKDISQVVTALDHVLDETETTVRFLPRE